MGTVDFQHNKDALNFVKSRLKARGLKLDTEEEWDVHGPHEDMNYQVYVGWAYYEAGHSVKCTCPPRLISRDCGAHKQAICVAVYPKRVYRIADGDVNKWCEVKSEDIIPIIPAN